MNQHPESLREEILRLTRQYARAVHRQNRPAEDDQPPRFVAGEHLAVVGPNGGGKSTLSLATRIVRIENGKLEPMPPAATKAA